MKTVYTMMLGTLLLAAVACGYSSKSSAPAAGTVPAITQLNPGSTTAGSAAFTMTVNGSNFSTKAVVNWNGAAQTASTTYITGGQLTVAIPAAMVANPGTAQITVTNPGTSGTGMYGGGTLPETSAAMNFTIN